MALSVHLPLHAPDERTLPNPVALLPNGSELRRSSSLLQHHISSGQFMTPAADEGARYQPITSTSSTKGNHEDQAHGEQARIKQRQGSTISEDSMTDISSEDPAPAENPPGYCLCVPEPKIPRPRNAFILYRQHQHPGVVAQHPKLPNPDISKIIGEQWRQLSVEDKNEWKALAEQEKARHTQQFPDYRYRPRRNGKFQSVDASQNPTSLPSNCAKCGGKIMNPPPTPHYATYEQAAIPASAIVSRGQKRGYTEAHGTQSQRQPSLVQMGSQGHPAPVHYGLPPRRESVHYVAQQGMPPHPQQRMVVEDPEAKRRRMNTPYPARQVYDQQYYDRERPTYQRESISRPMPPPVPIHRLSHAGPQILPRGSLPVQRKDPNLTLPPLKTALQSKAVISPTHPPRTDVEPCMMTYPLLSKLRVLSSITGTLPTPGSRSPTSAARGIVLAIEGLDHRKVNDMTTSLTEQLEKEGKFYVRTFRGPNPYQLVHSRRRASAEGKSEAFSHAKYFDFMAEWHKLYQEVATFITQKPSKVIQLEDEDQAMTDVGTPEPPAEKNAENDDQNYVSPYERDGTRRSPISAISPGTVQQTSNMTLDTPISKPAADSIPSPPLRITRSRVPQAALDARARTKVDSPPPPPPPPPPSSTRPVTPPPPPPTSPAPAPVPASTHDDVSNLIPVAIIPHYQLTTVNTCSIALPITDSYDPLTHWRWFATLWRGCPGPDISVVIHDESEGEFEASTAINKAPSLPLRTPGLGPPDGMTHRPSAPTNGAPLPSTSAHAPNKQMQPTSNPAVNATSQIGLNTFDVKVRLSDYHAVIVRTSTRGSFSSSSPRRASTMTGDGSGSASLNGQERTSIDEKENEQWEKAKRRVGFEVAEWMRR